MDWIDLAQDRGQVADPCECGDELSDSIKHGELLDNARTGQHFRKDSGSLELVSPAVAQRALSG